MISRTIVYERFASGEAVAVFTGSELEDFLFKVVDDEAALGTVFVGVVDRKLNGQGGWVVKLPRNLRGFLKSSKKHELGATILVQVSGYADVGKLVPVRERIELSGRYSIVTNARVGVSVSRQICDPKINQRVRAVAKSVINQFDELGVIVRSSAINADEPCFHEEVLQLANCFQEVISANEMVPTVIHNPPSVLNRAISYWGIVPYTVIEEKGSLKRYGVVDRLNKCNIPEVSLKRGGNLLIEPTTAFTAVDINTGKDISPKSGLKANIAAIRELPRQLRVRGIGGQIVIDFAPVSKIERNLVEERLEMVFNADKVATSLVGWTKLGHFEMHRHRDRLPLKRWLET